MCFVICGCVGYLLCWFVLVGGLYSVFVVFFLVLNCGVSFVVLILV